MWLTLTVMFFMDRYIHFVRYVRVAFRRSGCHTSRFSEELLRERHNMSTFRHRDTVGRSAEAGKSYFCCLFLNNLQSTAALPRCGFQVWNPFMAK